MLVGWNACVLRGVERSVSHLAETAQVEPVPVYVHDDTRKNSGVSFVPRGVAWCVSLRRDNTHMGRV